MLEQPMNQVIQKIPMRKMQNKNEQYNIIHQ